MSSSHRDQIEGRARATAARRDRDREQAAHRRQIASVIVRRELERVKPAVEALKTEVREAAIQSAADRQTRAVDRDDPGPADDDLDEALAADLAAQGQRIQERFSKWLEALAKAEGATQYKALIEESKAILIEAQALDARQKAARQKKGKGTSAGDQFAADMNAAGAKNLKARKAVSGTEAHHDAHDHLGHHSRRSGPHRSHPAMSGQSPRRHHGVEPGCLGRDHRAVDRAPIAPPRARARADPREAVT